MSVSPAELAGLSREEKLALLARLARERSRDAGADRGAGPVAGGGPGVYPLSFAQQRFWFLDQLEPGAHVNNMFRALRLSGPLDAAALERTLEEIVRRHPALRTRFPAEEGEPRQLVAAAPEAPVLARIDLSSLPAVEREERLLALATEEARRPFDLARGPLFRSLLARLGGEEHTLLVSLHHIVSDGWSLGLFFRELGEIYAALAAGRPSPLPEPALGYGDFARRQRDRLQGEALVRELAFWRERLEGAPPVLELPTDRPHRAAASSAGAIAPVALDDRTAAEIRAFAQREGATSFMALLALFNLLLLRYTEQRDFVVGLPVANRNRTEFETVIGCFASTLLLRAGLAPGMSFRELLARVRGEALAVFAHSDLPFEKLVEELQPERNLAHNPLFQVMFALQTGGSRGLELPGLALAPLRVERGLAKLDLTLELIDAPAGLSGYFEYSTELFDAATIARMAAHFRNLAAAAMAAPDAPVLRLAMLTPHERDCALAEWNPRAEPLAPPIPALIAARARLAPEAPAVFFGEETLSYGELERRANQLARRLRRLGVGPDTPVGVCFERSLAMPVALLAVLKAGGAWVPLDPAYPAERLALIIADTRMPVLLTEGRLVAGLPVTEEAAVAAVAVVAVDAEERRLAEEDPTDPEWPIHPESLAYVIYTSGSTGRPKGVGVPHRSLANHATACAEHYGLGPLDRVLQFTSISFDITSEEIFPTWLAGGAIVPRPPGLFPSFEELGRMIERYGITIVNLPTAYWNEWVGEMHRSGTQPPPSLRLVAVGTEQALPERMAEWLELAGDRVRFCNAYASTEATVTALIHEPGPGSLARARAGHRVPVGFPIRNCRAYILDANLEPVPVGVPGDVYIGGPNVSRGYLDWPERTAASFLPDPFAAEAGYGPGARLYRQGDRGRYLPDGQIECMGRSDDLVKIRGFRIEPGEIEAVLARHPAVKDCVVLVREEGPGGRRLVGYAAPVPGQPATPEELKSYLKETLPEYMVPAALVILETLPLTLNGKVDRRALSRIELPEDLDKSAAGDLRSPVEDLVAGIWAELLRRDWVGPHQNFFDLGGHSLLATQVISRIREALGVELPLRTLFERPTVGGLAAAVEAARRAEEGLVAPPVLPAPRDRPLVCSFSQQRLWVLDKLLPGSPAYNIPVAVRFAGPVDLGFLARALDGLVRRHESLRTTFAPGADGQPVQVVAPPGPLPMPPIVDLRGLGAELREPEALDALVGESVMPFDLDRGPLLRLYLFRLADEDLLLHFTLHHIVSDGASISLFIRELITLYAAVARGAAPALPELPVQYADFAAWQRGWLQGEVLERQLAYWRERLAGAPAAISLPADRPRPAVQTSNGARHYLHLPAGLVRRLETLGRRERSTLFMTLQAAFNVLLGRWSAQEDVLVGWPIAGRNRGELEGMIGFLANILVLRTDLAGEPSFRELLARVREAALGAYGHQDLPFEQLVEELRPERHLSHNPLFQVFFVLHHATGGGASLPGIAVSVPGIDNRTSRGDLLVSLSETRDGLAGFFEYNTDLFDAATMERMARHFAALLEGAADAPEAAAGALPMLAGDELRQIVEGWNDTAAAFPADLGVHQLFEARAAADPGAVALLFDGGGEGREEPEAWTYGELNAEANRLARHLRGRGVGPESLVGLCVERTPAMVVALLAILKAGGAYVPLDPTYPAERLAYVLADSGAKVLITHPDLRYIFPEDGPEDGPDGGREVIELDPVSGAPAEWSGESPEDLPPLAGPENLAYVIYTSGSTGRPKGVEVRHRGVVNFLATMARRPGLAAADILLAVTTISFDIAGLELYLPLAAGARVVLASRDTAADGALLAAAIGRHGITAMQATPATWRLLLAAGWPGSPGLKVLCGGEALPRELAVQLLDRVGELWNVYGPTETTIWSTVDRVLPGELQEGAAPIGRPIANTSTLILDRGLRPVPAGPAGELYIGGAGVARGYHGRPELTAERFIPDPWGSEPGARLYRTGDVARYLPSGRIAYLGRADHQVKVRGFRIEPGEIEAALARHPAVRQAVVLAREDTPGDPRLVAYFVLAEGQAASVGNLRAALREELPDYMIPSLFVPLAALPLTPNGKVDRKALPATNGPRLETGREHVPPEGPVQERLAAIWSEVLRLERVGATDNFFELGGHSLMAMQVLARVQEAFGIELPLRTMFDNPTVAALAEAIIQKELARADDDLLAKLLAELEGEPAGEHH